MADVCVRVCVVGCARGRGTHSRNVTVAGTPGKTEPFKESSDVPAANPQPAGPTDASVDKWHFISPL